MKNEKNKSPFGWVLSFAGRKKKLYIASDNCDIRRQRRTPFGRRTAADCHCPCYAEKCTDYYSANVDPENEKELVTAIG